MLDGEGEGVAGACRLGHVGIGQQVELGVEAAADVACSADRLVDRPALALTVLEVVRERVQSGGLHVRVGRQVELVVEAGTRIAAFLPAGLLVLFERVDPGGPHVGIGREIALRREEGVRVAAFAGTILSEVRVGVLARLEHVLVPGEIVEVINERLAVVHHDGGVREQEALEALHEVEAFRASDGGEAPGLRDGDVGKRRVEHERVRAAPSREDVVARAIGDDVVAQAAGEAIGEGCSLQHVVAAGSGLAHATGQDAVAAHGQVLDPRVGSGAGIGLAEGRHAVERFEILGDGVLLGALRREGFGVGQGRRRGTAQRHAALAVGREGIVVAAQARRRA